MRFTCQECYKSETDQKDFNLILLNSLANNNVYKLAFNYNKKIINNFREQSGLYLPFLQMDNYITINYYNKSNSYTLSMEPLMVTKNHLLSLYEPFLFISFEKKRENDGFRYSSQCPINNITMINQLGLFEDEIGMSYLKKIKIL